MVKVLGAIPAAICPCSISWGFEGAACHLPAYQGQFWSPLQVTNGIYIAKSWQESWVTLEHPVCSWIWNESFLPTVDCKSILQVIVMGSPHSRPLLQGTESLNLCRGTGYPTGWEKACLVHLDTWLCSAELHGSGWAKSRGKNRKEKSLCGLT